MARRAITRTSQITKLAVMFLVPLLMFSLFTLLARARSSPTPIESDLPFMLNALSFVLNISALALASAIARGLVGDRTARWVGRACWALLSASVIALCLSGVEVAVRNSPWVAWGALLTLRFLKPRGAPREPVEQPATEELYQRLLDAYLRAWGGPPERAKARVEAEIRKLVERGLSREEAVKRLYRRALLGVL